MNISSLNIDKNKIAYRIFGNGKINLIIEMGLGSCIGEWYEICETLSSNYTVLVYERNKVNNNKDENNKRNPQNIAHELFDILGQLPHENKVTIIAHSQGGLYATTFARKYPELVKGLILLDPLSPNDNMFKKQLTKDEYKKSGVDKLKSLLIIKKLVKCHLGFLVKLLVKNSPPFYYKKDFSNKCRNYILNSMVKIDTIDTAIDEYTLAHDENELKGLDNIDDFPDIPLVLITHSSEISINEIISFGHTSKDTAIKIEKLWQELMKKYLNYSRNSYYIEAKNSSHYIHLSDFECLYEGLQLIKNF